jgi:hypothetical protein
LKCEKHRNNDAVGFCTVCGSGVCDDCIVKSGEKSYCKECYNKLNKENEPSNVHDMSSAIVCDKCGGFYELKDGESLDDFEACECGGKLKPFKGTNNGYEESNHDQNYEETIIQFIVQIKKNINLRAILAGVIVVFGLSIITALLLRDSPNIFVLATPQESLYMPFAFVGALVTGYILGKNPKVGILNGFITSIFAMIISLFLIILAINIPNINYSSNLLNVLYLYLGIIDSEFQYFQIIYSINTLIITMIMGVIAGFLGVYLKIRDQTKQRVKLQRNPIIIGLLVSIMSGLILNLYTEWGFYLGILFGTTVVGYTVAKNYENGIKHGVIVGVVTILIFGIATTILAGTLFGVGTAVLLVLLTISEVIISGIIGSIGGTIGVVIKERWLKPVPAM